jgi:hypothetical protein
MRPLEFGWYLPTHGDTTAYGVPEAQVRFGRLIRPILADNNRGRLAA